MGRQIDTFASLAEILDRLLERTTTGGSASFRDLAEMAGLDPAHDFIGASLREIDFRDEDLTGFDFSDADLTGADFRRARVLGTRFDRANLTGAIGLREMGGRQTSADTSLRSPPVPQSRVSTLARMVRSHPVQATVGLAAAEYLRFVWRTSRLVLEPADIYDRIVPNLPVIFAMWHGQHFMVPFIRRDFPVKFLISRHRDGNINAIAAEQLGVGTIRGSGGASGRFDLKGGVGAFHTMLTTLAEGCTVALTADVPKVARVAGLGIIKLAQLSGRPILPAAVVTSRRKVLDNWDRTAINLPFSRLAMVAEETVTVPADADHDTLERCRNSLEQRLNRATTRAYEIVDGKAELLSKK
jgi:lysophospholipid acyltransferase (LPLAT)-like uncharacterized protein